MAAQPRYNNDPTLAEDGTPRNDSVRDHPADRPLRRNADGEPIDSRSRARFQWRADTTNGLGRPEIGEAYEALLVVVDGYVIDPAMAQRGITTAFLREFAHFILANSLAEDPVTAPAPVPDAALITAFLTSAFVNFNDEDGWEVGMGEPQLPRWARQPLTPTVVIGHFVRDCYTAVRNLNGTNDGAQFADHEPASPCCRAGARVCMRIELGPGPEFIAFKIVCEDKGHYRPRADMGRINADVCNPASAGAQLLTSWDMQQRAIARDRNPKLCRMLFRWQLWLATLTPANRQTAIQAKPGNVPGDLGWLRAILYEPKLVRANMFAMLETMMTTVNGQRGPNNLMGAGPQRIQTLENDIAAALAERDTAQAERDAIRAERDAARTERDNALAANPGPGAGGNQQQVQQLQDQIQTLTDQVTAAANAAANQNQLIQMLNAQAAGNANA